MSGPLPVGAAGEPASDLRGGPSLALTGVAAVALIFLCFPILVVVPMSFSSARSLEFPPPGWSLQWYEAFFGSPVWIPAALTSMLLASASATLALVLGTLAAYGLTRTRAPGHAAIEANIMAPLIVPSIIIAIGLYIVLARAKLLGSFAGLLAGHTLLALPYVVLFVSVAIRSFDIRIEQVAATLGASRTTIILKVLLPNLWPSAVIAWLFAFIVSFDEVVITFFVAGTYVTIPKRMFLELTLQINPVVTAVATLLILFNLIALGLLAWLSRRRGQPAQRLF